MSDSRQRIKKQVKQHIPKDWLCDLRIAYRITMEAFNDIKRTGVMNIVIITANENYTFIVDAVNCTAAGQGIFSDIYVAISVEHYVVIVFAHNSVAVGIMVELHKRLSRHGQGHRHCHHSSKKLHQYILFHIIGTLMINKLL